VQQLADKINDPSLVPNPGVKASIGFYGELVYRAQLMSSGNAAISIESS
jgi:hypothetical protein